MSLKIFKTIAQKATVVSMYRPVWVHRSKESSLHPIGSTTLGLQSTGNEKEQITTVTMGQGSVTNTTMTNNRDINNTQEIT
ncbi:hypothetical protein ACNPQK_07725 [Acinetobacter guillouiae]|uniref:hypothetical protein n=1 Tax=Acinetobacter guillouiae TaxID=106649 RepID=UPI00300A53DC